MEIRESFYGWKNESRSKIKISNYRFPSLFFESFDISFRYSVKKNNKKKKKRNIG